MKYFRLISLAALVLWCAIGAQAQNPVNVNDLEDEIKNQEEIVSQNKEDIEDLEAQIKVLKERLDSIKGIEKEVKDQISDLEKQKKELEKGIKQATQTRKETFATRDNVVFDNDIAHVLSVAYDKRSVEKAMKNFDGMETKQVLERKKLLENYGKYTKDLRQFLEKQKAILAADEWAMQDPKSETLKKFVKGLKGTSYWKIYDKSVKNPSIPYLDNVMEQIMQQVNNGLCNQRRYSEILDLLYTTD